MEPDASLLPGPERRDDRTEIVDRGVTVWSNDGPGDSIGTGLELVAGRYEVLGLLGEGGMGTVYKVRDRELDEVVALKMLRADFARGPKLLDRFRREVKLARRVTHPHVARTYDIGEHGSNRFLTMEYFEGKSLGVRRRESALPLTEVLAIVRAIAEGLGAAHAQGIVHRDLKPDNVLLGTDGRVAISDFGIARLAEGEDDGPSLTAGGMIGTPEYMAPEQLDGRSDVDGRADLYALGIIVYELVAGARPWKGSTPMAILQARALHPRPDLRTVRPDLPAEILDLVDRCLAESPADRFADVGEFLAALDRVCPEEAARCSCAGPVAGDRGTTLRRLRTVAVLPFVNAGEPEDAYLSHGLAEDLIDGLSVVPGLRVRPSGATQGMAGLDPMEAGRRLGVQVVVEGTVRRHGPAIRVATRLIGVEDGFQLWAGRFTCPTEDLLVACEEAARAVAHALTVEAAERGPVARDERAVDLYLRARHRMHQDWYTDMRPVIELFEEALERAPRDPRFLAGAATAHARQAFLHSENDRHHVRKAIDLASRAIRLDPARGEPYQALGMARFNDGDVAGAVRSLREATRRTPTLAEAHFLLGQILLEIESPEAALGPIDRALELDPNLFFCRQESIRARALLGDWQAVDAALAIPVEGEAPRAMRQILLDRLAMWRRLGPPGPGDEPGVEATEGRPGRMAALLREVRSSGRLELARRREVEGWAAAAGEGSRFRRVMLQMLVEMSLHAGDAPAALEDLARTVDAGLIDRVWLERCPLLEPIRREDRFAALADEVAARVDVLLAETRAP